MKTIANIATLAICFSAAQAHAENDVEVMHFWTSGGEAAALSVIRDRVVVAGIFWEDTPIVGGGGDQARTALQARIAEGNPPSAMLMLGQNIINWADEGLLGEVNAVAETEGWDAVLSQAVMDFSKINGNYVAAPTNVHRTDMIWASREAFDAIGANYPTTWEEFNALAPRFIEAGIVPIAHGGQAWQEAYMFEALVLGVGGPDFYRDALVELNPDALSSETMQSVFAQMAEIRGMVDDDFAGRDWDVATSMVINGEAAMQIMGDWAKGEFTNAGQRPGQHYACIPIPTAGDEGFIYTVNSLSFFAQPDADAADTQAILATVIMDPEVQVAFSQAKGAIPARTDSDVSSLDECGQANAAAFSASEIAGTAVPTFAGTHAAQANVVAAASEVITDFFNSDMSPEDATGQLAEAVELALGQI
ncbi:putative sugar-binding periplasmic protein [Pontivivens insulae]|uniref:Probable sugar-binding periplasmic protein n=2 Tax=Pontivivens insulae TaxID=1639689 RepID=A0A2R8AEG8_9RHOB|nr:glucose/mannose transport system substrate-binding protein [Pontivivens insulae]SPF30498.1 putative sugar-binding periplasmic protein [Pontivivens insulae]